MSSTDSSSGSFDSVRDKARTALTKQLNASLAKQLDNKLYQHSNRDETKYRSYFRTLTNLLKSPKVDDNNANNNTNNEIIDEKQTIKYKLINNELTIKQLGELLFEKENKKQQDIKELIFENNEQKAIELQKIKEVNDANLVNAVKSAKAEIAETKNINNASSWSKVGDTSLQLFLKGSPNLSFTTQALKAYTRVETVDKQYGTNNPNLYIRRGTIHLFMEDYEATMKDWNAIVNNANANEIHKTIANERINSINTYLQSTAELIKNNNNLSNYQLKKVYKDIPVPNTKVGDRDIITLNKLNSGENVGKGILVKVLAVLNRDSLQMNKYYTSNSTETKTDSNTTTVSGKDFPLQGSESLQSICSIPALSYLVIDSNGTIHGLSIFNVVGKPNKPSIPVVGDLLLVFEPLLRRIGVNKAGFNYNSIQVENPNWIFVNYTLWDRTDIAIFYS